MKKIAIILSLLLLASCFGGKEEVKEETQPAQTQTGVTQETTQTEPEKIEPPLSTIERIVNEEGQKVTETVSGEVLYEVKFSTGAIEANKTLEEGRMQAIKGIKPLPTPEEQKEQYLKESYNEALASMKETMDEEAFKKAEIPTFEEFKERTEKLEQERQATSNTQPTPPKEMEYYKGYFGNELPKQYFELLFYFPHTEVVSDENYKTNMVEGYLIVDAATNGIVSATVRLADIPSDEEMVNIKTLDDFNKKTNILLLNKDIGVLVHKDEGNNFVKQLNNALVTNFIEGVRANNMVDYPMSEATLEVKR